MSQEQTIVDVFRQHNNRMTLGQILTYPFGYEFRARATEMRRRGYQINLISRDTKHPSLNTYQLIEPTRFEQGQGVLL